MPEFAGIDHVALSVTDLEHSPIQDRPLGHHLNFRDPDRLALELQAPRSSPWPSGCSGRT
jgi:hypothetical protein